MHGLYCLMIEEQQREEKEELFRDYVGQCLWHIVTIQHFKTTEENKMPQYVELSHPEKVEKVKPITAEEVKEHLLFELGC